MPTILLVEEQHDERQNMRQALIAAGYELLLVGTTGRAIAILEEREVDAVIIDLLPSPERAAQFEQVHTRAAKRKVPVLACLEAAQPAVRTEILERGADDLLIKPFDGHELCIRVAFLLDATARRRSFADHQDELAELRAFRDDLFDLLVHDLKGPLSVIQGNLEFLEDQLADAPPALSDAMDDTVDAASELNRIFGNLLDVVPAEVGRMPLFISKVRLDDLYAAVIKARRREAQHLGLHLETVPTRLQFEADAWVLRRVVENILDNAMRYTPRGGRVVLRGGPRPDGGVRLELANSGPPIPPTQRAYMFEKFGRLGHRSTSARFNLGLGLYFCHLAVVAHHGSICIEERADFPTTFVIDLPAPSTRGPGQLT